MPVAQGSCPSCGAPIEFGVGASIAKVCEYCSATILRTDRGLQDLGKVAAIANTPALIAVGDQGRLAGRSFEVLGRVQLDHGKGPWDEYYVGFDGGNRWGWLAYAQGRWHVTEQMQGLAIPPYDALRLEMDVPIGQQAFRVVEIKSGRIVSAEGELPAAFPPGFMRYYADCLGRNSAFATLDYGDNRGAYEVFVGWIFDETQLEVTQLGPRSVHKVRTDMIKCPSCGGDVPKLSGERSQRVGCPYCGAVSDIGTQQVIAQQEAALKLPDVPIGSRGLFDGVEYVTIAYLRRSSVYEGERYGWEEYLLWSQPVGYRWLVKDPETGWSWTMAANPADIDLRGMPEQIAWGGRFFSLRNRSSARVDYVLGEVYWQCEVGETTAVSDFVNGRDVLSREEGGGEVHWSHSAPMAWPAIAQAFGLPVEGAGGVLPVSGAGEGSAAKPGCATALIVIIIVVVVLMFCMINNCDDCSDGGYVGGGYRGGGIYSGGK